MRKASLLPCCRYAEGPKTGHVGYAAIVGAIILVLVVFLVVSEF
jgi:hypothetical protein